MSSGLYSHTTRATGTTLTATIYNGDHVNHITNQTPQMTGAYSDNAGQMQTNTDPGGVGSESLAGSLAGELERLRFVLKRITNGAQWYAAPTWFTVSGANVSLLGTLAVAGATSLTGDLTVQGSSMPQNSKSAAYTTVLADANKHIFHPVADNTPRTFTIDSNANVAYAVGTSITFVNKINTVTIAITSDTLTLAGTASTGSRTLIANGIATAVKITSTEWLISGVGLS